MAFKYSISGLDCIKTVRVTVIKCYSTELFYRKGTDELVTYRHRKEPEPAEP